MSSDIRQAKGCSEKYAELCAVSASCDLSAEETADLYQHVDTCPSCRTLLSEYLNLTHLTMATLAAELPLDNDDSHSFPEPEAERRLLAALNAERQRLHRRSRVTTEAALHFWRSFIASPWAFALGAAGCLVICIGAVAWHGRSPEPGIHNAIRTEKSVQSATVAGLETAELQKKLVVAQESLDETRTRADEDEMHLVKLGNAKDLLLAQVAQLEQKNQSISDSIALAAQQRDELQKQLDDSSRSLEQTREDLNHAREDRTASMLRVAGLERQVDSLRSMAGAAIGDTPSDEQLLTKDRDIRELMGARQLYIADVFDIQHDGQPSKPFGRVFYTKGKSLIFYAFDLQTQPGSVDTKAFQAWGRRDVPSAKPVSLGIFYLDSEQNRRWIVKTTDSSVLAKINAVFVTVEPRGGSPQPTGKPFLEAYLHTLPPNHP